MNAWKKIFTSGLIIIAFMLMLSSCNQKNPTDPRANASGALVYFNGCKESASMKATADSLGGLMTNKECLEYDFDGNILRLKHINAALNCCADEVTAEVSIDDSFILIEPKEVYQDGPCFCTCLYDIDYEIRDLKSGAYKIIIKSFELPLELDLTQPISGTYCEDRNNYPWTQYFNH